MLSEGQGLPVMHFYSCSSTLNGWGGDFGIGHRKKYRALAEVAKTELARAGRQCGDTNGGRGAIVGTGAVSEKQVMRREIRSRG